MKQQWLVFTILMAALYPSLRAQSPAEIRVYQPDTGYLGINIRDVRAADVSGLQLPREAGVYIERVEAGSAAAESDLQAGDVVIGYSGISVLSVRHFRRLVEDTPPGRSVGMSLVRSGETIQKSVTVGNRKRPGMRAFTRSLPEFEVEKEFTFPMGPEAYKRRFFIFPDRPRLGIQGSDLTEQMGEFLGVQKRGVLVLEVMDGSPAQRADLQAGDVITVVEGHSIASLHDLTRRLTQATHALAIVRRQKTQLVTVHLGDPQEEPEELRL